MGSGVLRKVELLSQLAITIDISYIFCVSSKLAKLAKLTLSWPVHPANHSAGGHYKSASIQIWSIEFAPRSTVGHLAVVFFVVDRGSVSRRRRKSQPKKKLWVQGFVLREDELLSQLAITSQ